jgi:DNA-binding NarL/FixJ family response regulator
MNYCNFERFTKREWQCLAYFLRGHTAKQTAEALFLSARTVESHLINIKQKTCLRTRQELYAWSLEKGFLQVTLNV